MNDVSEIFAPGDQWILPPVPLLDEEFDDDDDAVSSLGIPVYVNQQNHQPC